MAGTTYEDIRYEKDAGVATITIDRPEVFNAFRAQTVEELLDAFRDAWADRTIGAVILTGAGPKAFCTGGDQSAKTTGGGYGGNARSDLGIDIEDLHTAIRDIPKPVIAAVNGYAIGGGHVLHVICDITIAADTARFGQVGPKVGSVDPGFGTAYLARVVGEKRAREIWYFCRQYSAEQALGMGLVNAVVPAAELMTTARAWADELLERSPTAIKLAKASFNAASEHIRGIAALGMAGLALYYDTEESAEGGQAFQEKRPPDFSRFRR
ncbi:MAG TPA: enoyl-CoA hydratase-related protein [Acidimicrobiia bacterium]|nr:enoyl-CoA hydratase-related protein [Acidimicrobiia bacterium]